MFGEIKGKGLKKPNQENDILYAILSVSYYEHNNEDGSSITLQKCMMVSNKFFAKHELPHLTIILNLNFIYSTSRHLFNLLVNYMKGRWQGALLEKTSVGWSESFYAANGSTKA